MPVTTSKTKKGYTNSTPGGIKGRGMTKKNAARQKRLLNAVEHSDWRPTGAKAKDEMKRAALRNP
jgi:hypothetical protein